MGGEVSVDRVGGKKLQRTASLKSNHLVEDDGQPPTLHRSKTFTGAKPHIVQRNLFSDHKRTRARESRVATSTNTTARVTSFTSSQFSVLDQQNNNNEVHKTEDNNKEHKINNNNEVQKAKNVEETPRNVESTCKPSSGEFMKNDCIKKMKDGQNIEAQSNCESSSDKIINNDCIRGNDSGPVKHTEKTIEPAEKRTEVTLESRIEPAPIEENEVSCKGDVKHLKETHLTNGFSDEIVPKAKLCRSLSVHCYINENITVTPVEEPSPLLVDKKKHGRRNSDTSLLKMEHVKRSELFSRMLDKYHKKESPKLSEYGNRAISPDSACAQHRRLDRNYYFQSYIEQQRDRINALSSKASQRAQPRRASSSRLPRKTYRLQTLLSCSSESEDENLTNNNIFSERRRDEILLKS